MSISAVDKDLADLVARDEFRASLNQTSEAYAEMQTFITNIESDLRSILTYTEELERQEQMGFDVGSSRATLKFQEGQMQTDLDFFQSMKTLYLRRIYADMHQFATNIATSAATIEPRPAGQTVEQLRDEKMRLAREFNVEGIYTMQDAYAILGLCENLLLELASDIAAFTPKIQEAEARANRGFQVGSLITMLRSQQVRLRTEFISSIEQIKEFLAGNARFAARCLRRIQLISNEIVTREEAAAATPDATADAGDDAGDADDDAGDAAA